MIAGFALGIASLLLAWRIVHRGDRRSLRGLHGAGLNLAPSALFLEVRARDERLAEVLRILDHRGHHEPVAPSGLLMRV
jgi:hypothetical protein